MMEQPLPVVKMQDTWNSLVKQLGAFKSIRSTSTTTKEGCDYVTVTCNFEKMLIDIQVVYNPERKIAGLTVRAA